MVYEVGLSSAHVTKGVKGQRSKHLLRTLTNNPTLLGVLIGAGGRKGGGAYAPEQIEELVALHIFVYGGPKATLKYNLKKNVSCATGCGPTDLV